MTCQIFFVAVSLLLIFSEVVTENSPNCPAIYQRFSTSHSYCQPKNQACDILQSGLTPQQIEQVVNIHNNYRSTIATQRQAGLPEASDMLFMEWDDELAKIAQRHADQCVYAHDKGDQRRVRNFGVGQNIAKMTLTGTNVQPPQADWPAALKSFYREIDDFSSDMICGSRDSKPSQKITGHFTQLVWSRTFRVGCGYTMYKEGNTYIRLYVCNYGPGGNVKGSCVYKEGTACSECPRNTRCTTGIEYPGLCKRINNEAPYQPIKVPHFFNCNFRNPSSTDCNIFAFGDGTWYYIPALSGKYVEVELEPGQNGTIVFSKTLTPSVDAKSMCIQIRYRKGPNLAKNQQNNVAKALFVIPSSNDFTAIFNFPNYGGDFRQQFTAYSLSLGWNSETQLKISFAVPPGASSQFFNIASVVGFKDKCENVEY